MKTIPYSEARLQMRVGDTIACRGYSIMSTIIRQFKGGSYDLSHLAKIVRDTTNQGTGHVEVLEAVNEGLDTNLLSNAYAKLHGDLFWIPMGYNKIQQNRLMLTVDELLEAGVKYDWWATILAPFQNIGFVMDLKKFNCSEICWYLDVLCDKVKSKYNKKNKQIAPVPGDYPLWVCREIYKLTGIGE